MGKRIRHLEYYGYADQNVYIGLPNADLSDIREVNKEQDKEINEISGATSGKADASTVKELSGKVDTFIEKQGIIVGYLFKGVKKNKERIDNLEARDEEITNKVNEIVDDIEGLDNTIDSVSAKTNSIETELDNHIAESEQFEDNINAKVSAIEDSLSDKIDKTEAYDTFAKKSDVYTKQEIDGIISGQTEEYASKQWVIDQGYLKESDANDRFATKDSLQELDDKITNIQCDLDDKYDTLSSSLSATNETLDYLNDKVDGLIDRYDTDVDDLIERVDNLEIETSQNTEAIRIINEVSLPNKADKSDVDNLADRVDGVEHSLDTKLDKSDYVRDITILNSELDHIRDTKADRSEIAALSGDVSTFDDRLAQEIQNRIAGDNALNVKIVNTNARIDEIREENIDRDENIRNLQSGLTKEISDRISGDKAIIGTPGDIDDDLTIYGAKKYADKVASQILLDAKDYADIKDGRLKNYVDAQDDILDMKITAKADKTYVNELRNELQTTIDYKVEEETNRATSVEDSIVNALRQETLRAVGKENAISNALSHTSNIVKALTDWDGDDRADYTDVGNGIVDVMHREMHTMNLTLFANARYNNLDNKIHFYNRYGTEVCAVSITDISPSIIESAWYEDGIIYIKFTNGETIEIDVRELIDENEFADGLQVVDGVVSVLKDESSEDYLSISENGVKISGINEKMQEIENYLEEVINNKLNNITIDCGIY